MHITKKLISLAMVFSTTACLSLEGAEIAGLPSSSSGKLTKFYCENGYKGSFKLRDNGVASLAYSDGKNSYITYMKNISSGSGELYVNDKNTLRWHHKMGSVIFNYPESNYATTKKLATTHCKTR